MFRNRPIKDLMVSPVVTLRVDDPFHKVEEKLRLKGIRHLPVIDDTGKLVGLITQRDFFRFTVPRMTEDGPVYVGEALDELILKHIMTHDPLAMGPEEDLAKAVEVMARNKYGCIPIVDKDHKLIGILTETDILRELARNL